MAVLGLAVLSAPGPRTGGPLRHPDAAGVRYLRCRVCEHILGALVAGHLNVIHDGAEFVGDPRFLTSIRCKNRRRLPDGSRAVCGTVNYSPWLPNAETEELS